LSQSFLLVVERKISACFLETQALRKSEYEDEEEYEYDFGKALKSHSKSASGIPIP
jgi:hypothetical protein